VERQPTIRDVARAAGVGASTVSLALRNDPRLRASTRERVQKVAQEIGYLPNATLASLMAHLRAGQEARFQATLGFLNASDDPAILREISTFSEWQRGAAERARELGYGMDSFWLREPGVSPERLREILQARGIRGLIVAGMQSDGALPESHKDFWASFITVVIGLRPQAPTLHFASNDQYLTARRAVKELRNLGYNRLGLVLDQRIDSWLEDRFSAGFFSGIRRVPESFGTAFDFRKDRFDAFAEWLQTSHLDVMITLHHEVEEWLQRLRVQVPHDLGLVHLDRHETMIHWAGMDQNNNRIGAAATDMVVGGLHRNEQGVPAFPRSVTLQSVWVPGDSVTQQIPAAQADDPRKSRSPSVPTRSAAKHSKARSRT
jgi:LacI family transcriptional regulator